ncbi:MAG: hypothetical protein ACOCTT_03570 [archaeon]
MKTYLKIIFNSEGEKSTSVTDRLMSKGFEPLEGKNDYVYHWNDNNGGVEDALKIAERVYSTLGGCGVYFSFETTE